MRNSIKKLNKLVNTDLKHLVNWLNANKISLNVKKTEMVTWCALGYQPPLKNATPLFFATPTPHLKFANCPNPPFSGNSLVLHFRLEKL